MKREVVVGGEKAQLEVEGNTYRYGRAGGESVSGTFRVSPVEPGSYLVEIGSRCYRVTAGANGEVSVNGHSLVMKVTDPRAFRSGGQGKSQGGPIVVSAVMPGKVVRVLVSPGDRVEAGQGLIVVEAMKMQNELRAPREGTIDRVAVAVGENVEVGDLLLVIS